MWDKNYESGRGSEDSVVEIPEKFAYCEHLLLSLYLGRSTDEELPTLVTWCTIQFLGQGNDVKSALSLLLFKNAQMGTTVFQF